MGMGVLRKKGRGGVFGSGSIGEEGECWGWWWGGVFGNGSVGKKMGIVKNGEYMQMGVFGRRGVLRKKGSVEEEGKVLGDKKGVGGGVWKRRELWV